ncbi:MAG: hypothetical protein ACM3ZV_00630 [Bacillota bacterium]
MTRVFLAAGVAALAIAAPASAGPGGHGGGEGGQAAFVGGGGGGQRAQAQDRRGGGARAERQAAVQQQRAERQQRLAAVERPQRAERMQMRAERQQARPQHVERAQTRVADRQQVRAERQQAQARVAERQQVRANRQQAQTRVADRQQIRENRQQQVQARMAQQQQLRVNRQQQVQAQIAQRQDLRANRINERMAANGAVGYGVGGCPPGLQAKGCMPPGQAAKLGIAPTGRLITAQNAAALRSARVDALNDRLGTRLLAPAVATSLLGVPVSTAPSVLGMSLNPLPQEISYLYPATRQYYYQYAPGYVYQVDRGSNLIAALIPLLAGGYLPGSYLPSAYMNSYVPDYYGLNSFYPASYGAGYGYQNLCNRYAYGVVYQVDCVTGMVENVIPTYAGGYGVGQMLPSAYSYYNVPMQYRSLYYPTNDYSYWYAPGAIYQYDPSTSLITSVAALMSPGFTIGQPLPMGYQMYNVPMAYRSTYYDTANAWYRYNNGYIYQVDPATQLVTAIVASLLT